MVISSGIPLARAVRTKLLPSTSIMLARVRRAMAAICGKQSAITGRMKFDGLPQPPTGSQPSISPKTRVSSGATTKLGTAIPSMEKPIAV